MLTAIKRFFNDHIQSGDGIGDEPSEQAVQLACAALLLEMARADFDMHDDELAHIAESLRAEFNLSTAQTEELVALADQEAQQATCHYEFISLINDGFSQQKKIRLIELLWQVAYADKQLSKYEEAMVRKLADLLYVRHSEFIAAKHRVLSRIQQK
jgi:uncharacterized tellurite resistance protein B-like protein